MQKYKVGLLVGRFQPFHYGHLYLIRQAFHQVEQIIIGIGSVGVFDKNNFLTYQKRKKMVEMVIKQEGWKDKIIKIVALPDFHNDELWLKNNLKVCGKIDVVIGNNEWTNGIFERAGYPILRLGFNKRHLYKGVKIRRLIAEGKHWEERVPKYLVKIIKKIEK